MNLPGRLRLTTLGDLLGALYRAGVNGVLELVESGGALAGRTHRIYLEQGLIDDIETPLPAPRLGEVLSREGHLGGESLRELLRHLARSGGKRAGEILIEAQLATPEAVMNGLRRQIGCRLDALFSLGEAQIRFHVRSPARRPGGRPRPLSPREFLHGRPRARLRRAGADGQAATKPAAYRALGLDPSAGLSDVRGAFRRLASEVHPDRHPHAPAAERIRLLKRFAELSAAYHAIVG